MCLCSVRGSRREEQDGWIRRRPRQRHAHQSVYCHGDRRQPLQHLGEECPAFHGVCGKTVGMLLWFRISGTFSFHLRAHTVCLSSSIRPGESLLFKLHQSDFINISISGVNYLPTNLVYNCSAFFVASSVRLCVGAL